MTLSTAMDPEEDFDDLHWQIVEVMREGRATPSYLAKRTGESRQLVSHRLRDLCMGEHVEKVHKGLYELKRPAPTREETTTTPDRDPAPAGPPTSPVETASDADLRERAETVLDELDVPGRPRSVERTRREAIMYAWDRLREEGSMETWRLAADTLGQYWDDPDLNYSTSGAAHRGPGYQLWDNCVRDTLRELPGVHAGDPWEFREPGETDE